MFKKILIANRGEIAVRVARTLREMGISAVAVFSDADAGAKHVRVADEAVRIGPAPATESYLNIDAVISAAKCTGAEAIHPGYGFLSENAEFARACAEAGLVFIGPPVSAIESMGDKIAAKTKVAAAGVSVVPGRHDPAMTDGQVIAAVSAVGYPALLKPSAGGGGKGMRVLRDGDDVAAAVVSARREASRSFGDDTLLVERFVERPRHIEIQVLADVSGEVIHLGERECSLQRRHQKVIEEAPSPFLTPDQRERMGAAAVEVARSCGYVGAGTVEFIVSSQDAEAFYFLEMNTRLQVEHPVTELVTGLDLVREQIRIAAGEPLGFSQDDVELTGHAVEARVYAEDPDAAFLPSAGDLLLVAEPIVRGPEFGPRIRVDSGVETGVTVGTDYDPMLSKIIAYADSRDEAIGSLIQALGESAYLGMQTNVAYLRELLSHPQVRAGDLHTGFLDDLQEQRQLRESSERAVESEGLALAAAGLERLDWLSKLSQAEIRWGRTPMAGDPWLRTDGWRLGESEWVASVLTSRRNEHTQVRVRGTTDCAQVRVGDGPVLAGSISVDGSRLRVRIGEELEEFFFARSGDELWLSARGTTWSYREVDRLAADVAQADDSGLDPITSPMPGTVLALGVEPGDQVAAGQSLATVEAMKMEHALSASVDATVSEVLVRVGDRVGLGDELIRFATVESSEQ